MKWPPFPLWATVIMPSSRDKCRDEGRSPIPCRLSEKRPVLSSGRSGVLLFAGRTLLVQQKDGSCGVGQEAPGIRLILFLLHGAFPRESFRLAIRDCFSWFLLDKSGCRLFHPGLTEGASLGLRVRTSVQPSGWPTAFLSLRSLEKAATRVSYPQASPTTSMLAVV